MLATRTIKMYCQSWYVILPSEYSIRLKFSNVSLIKHKICLFKKNCGNAHLCDRQQMNLKKTYQKKNY